MEPGVHWSPMQGRLALAGALAAVLTWPAAAAGSTVSVQSGGENDELFYEADGGEANRLTATSDGSDITVRDPGASISAGSDCTSISPTRAECTLGGFARINADLKGLADRAKLKTQFLIGNLEGGGGGDVLIGASKSDVLDGGAGPDLHDGRGSADLILYRDRADDLKVTLGDGVRNDGGPQDGPSRDVVRRIEGVVGGAGDDVLVGTSGENNLVGMSGRDTLRGKDGGDTLSAGGGADLSKGGRGGDVFAGGAGDDLAFGGRGADLFQGGSPLDGADLFEGGPGHDSAAYTFGPVRLRLDDKANDGQCTNASCAASNEGDNLKGTEELSSGFGDDVLIGSKRDEVFNPFPGADRIRAKGGDDEIALFADGDIDVADCGPGDDVIRGSPDATDQNPNCESQVP